MIDNHLLQVAIEAAVSAITGAIMGGVIAFVRNNFFKAISYWLIGAVLFIVSIGLFYVASLEKVSYWWVVGGIVGILFAFLIYKRYFDFPFKKWRVNNNRGIGNMVTKQQRHDPGLLSDQEGIEGIPIGKTWMFKARRQQWAVYGPYIATLGKGKYKAIFKIKVLGIAGRSEDIPKRDIIKIDVASENQTRGDTSSSTVLTTRNFSRANKFQKFTIEFKLDEIVKNVELRIEAFSTEHFVVLDYIKLSRRGL